MDKEAIVKQIKTGQIFEIFLDDIQKYTYGAVIRGDLVLNKYDNISIGYLDVFSDNPLEVEEIYSCIREHKFLMIANSG
ncbi:hypothetical protein [Peribacillus sp. SI8-4]|uniref:hypothetical protein n=1 Tax=Peribacillus sp. SI8-4 TaxID=3048009 RepID=UPI002554F6B8|nr:hypothetical protein [Peribacillus sp. SI8-4]